MILVTGGAGFAGSRVVARLVQQGESPRVLVRDVAKAKKRLPASGVEFVVGDTTQPDTLGAAVEGVDTIIHCAFITADRKQGPGVNYAATNVTGTKNLIAAAKNAGVQRIVEMGGLGTRASTPGSYMEGRFEADEALKRSGLAWSILGPSIQFGHGSPFFNGLAGLLKSVPVVVPVVGDGKLQFQPIWVDDVARCILMMAQQPEQYDGKVIEVGGPEIFTYNQILDLLMQTLRVSRIKAPGPKPLVKLGATLMSAVLPKPPITPAAVELFDFENTTALDSVERNFGFTPLSLRTYLTENGLD